MTETSSRAPFEPGRNANAADSTQHPASAAASQEAERRPIIWATGAILLALAVAVVLLRLYRIDELPQGIQSDEGPDGVYALQVLEGKHAVFFPEMGSGREWMGVYTIALTTSLLGRTLLAFRLPTVLASAGAVFAVFWLGRLLFGRGEDGRATPWRGLLIGGVGAGLLAVSLSQTTIGRASLRANFLPLFLALCFALLWWGWLEAGKQRTWWRIALAGVCAGLLPYTYVAARFIPFLFLFFGLSFLLPFRSGVWERVRAALPRAVIFIGVAALVAAPILVYFALHPEQFFIRSKEVWLLQDGQGTLWRALLNNVWEHLLAFGFRGDWRVHHNYAGRPMLNPWEAFFFWFGAGMALWRWRRRPAYRLLLLWLGVLLLPAFLSRDRNAELGPHTLRMIGAAPAVYLLIGVGMWEAYRCARERLWPPARDSARQSFRAREPRAVIALGAVVSGLILAQGVITYRTYFHEWAVTTAFFLGYHGEWADAARALNAQPAAADIIYLLPYRYNEHYGFEYLYHGPAPALVIYANRPDLPQKVASTLAAMDTVSSVKVLDWNDNFDWSGEGDENLVALLSRFGRYRGSDEFANFQLHTYTDIAWERPWTFYEYLEPRTVQYDGGISLLGYALGRGEEQLSAQEMINLGKERALWLALQWQTAPELDIDYWISVRLHDAGGAPVYQNDVIPLDLSRAQTSQWQDNEPVDTLFHLDLPTGLPPGEYELRLIVYDSETLTPTVELGIWEPEAVLARLRLTESN